MAEGGCHSAPALVDSVLVTGERVGAHDESGTY